MADGGKAEDRLLLGEIKAAVGLRGELRLHSFTEEPAAIADYGPLETERPGRTLRIEKLRTSSKGLVATFEGVSDRNAAEALTGTKLYIDRAKLPQSAPDEWYYADLIGLAAFDRGGAAIGVVTAVHNFGASDIIELTPQGGSSKAGKPESGKPILLPFTGEAVPEVDIAAGRLTVQIPEGLVDAPADQEERPEEE